MILKIYIYTHNGNKRLAYQNMGWYDLILMIPTLGAWDRPKRGRISCEDDTFELTGRIRSTTYFKGF